MEDFFWPKGWCPSIFSPDSWQAIGYRVSYFSKVFLFWEPRGNPTFITEFRGSVGIFFAHIFWSSLSSRKHDKLWGYHDCAFNQLFVNTCVLVLNPKCDSTITIKNPGIVLPDCEQSGSTLGVFIVGPVICE